MSYYSDQRAITAVAVGDQSARQYHFVTLTAEKQFNMATSGKDVIGVLQNKPLAGEHGQICVDGISKVVAGGAISANALVTTNTSGRATAVASGGWAVGRALTSAGADGQIISVLVFTQAVFVGN